MADIQATLSKKVGPLPLWGWAAAAGGAVSVIYLARRGAAQSGTAGTSGQQPNVPYVPSPIIVTPSTMPDGTSSINAPPSSPSQGPQVIIRSRSTSGPYAQFDTLNPGVPVFSKPGSGSIGFAPFGSSFPAAGSPVSGASNGFTTQYWPITYAGITAYVGSNDVAGSGGGSSSGVMNYVPGSGGGKLLRHVGNHAHQQYLRVTGMGGGVQTGPWAQDPRGGMAGMGGGGHARLQAVSQKTGVPVTRLMSLNPPWKRRGHIHIA